MNVLGTADEDSNLKMECLGGRTTPLKKRAKMQPDKPNEKVLRTRFGGPAHVPKHCFHKIYNSNAKDSIAHKSPAAPLKFDNSLVVAAHCFFPALPQFSRQRKSIMNLRVKKLKRFVLSKKTTSSNLDSFMSERLSKIKDRLIVKHKGVRSQIAKKRAREASGKFQSSREVTRNSEKGCSTTAEPRDDFNSVEDLNLVQGHRKERKASVEEDPDRLDFGLYEEEGWESKSELLLDILFERMRSGDHEADNDNLWRPWEDGFGMAQKGELAEGSGSKRGGRDDEEMYELFISKIMSSDQRTL